MNAFLEKAAKFFIEVKAPELREKVDTALKAIEAGTPLEDKFKKLLGFILFSYSMNIGPPVFLQAEWTAEEIGVAEELKEYAKDWINYAKSKSNTDV